MSEEPTYPADAPVGQPVGGDEASPGASAADGTAENAPAKTGPRGRKVAAGAAIGVGSAALVAALLYANRARKKGQS